MAGLPRFEHPNLLVGSDNFDDAGVYQLTEDIAIIQTLDFFTPMVDDAYRFGQIAAANALSDIYAMGGKPLTAMNIAAFPTCVSFDLIGRILKGGADTVIEADALLIGGHTVVDNEPKYGLSVTGIAHPKKIITNDGGQEGDLLFLTKHLGTGILNTAVKGGFVTESDIDYCVKEMATLNKDAAFAMTEVGVKGGTDITGFGFLGHLSELTRASQVSAEIWSEALPYWPKAGELAAEEICPGGLYRNMEFLKNDVYFREDVPEWLRLIMFDPQTSGGLLMAVPKSNAAKLEGLLELAQVEYAIVGKLQSGGGINVIYK